MSEQKQVERTVDQCVGELLKGVHQKEGLAVSLLQLAAQERQLISCLPTCARQISHEIYHPFLQQERYLLLKLTGETRPIWLSDNL
jgi:hypothetical protein